MHANDSGIDHAERVGRWLKWAGIEYVAKHRTECLSSFGNLITVDFFLADLDPSMYLEVRSQNTAGSVAQKDIALYHEIIDCYDRPTAVVFCGPEKRKSIAYFEKKGTHGNNWGGWSFDRFKSFCRDIREDGKCPREGITGVRIRQKSLI